MVAHINKNILSQYVFRSVPRILLLTHIIRSFVFIDHWIHEHM